MIPDPVTQTLIVSINHLSQVLQSRTTVIVLAPYAVKVSPGLWNVSITADLITAIGAIIIVALICGTVLFGLGMCQSHYRMKALSTQDREVEK